MNKIKRPNRYTEAAFNIVLSLNSSGWFRINDIYDPRSALKILSEAISQKYRNSLLPIKGTVFSNEELYNIKMLIRQDALHHWTLKCKNQKSVTKKI